MKNLGEGRERPDCCLRGKSTVRTEQVGGPQNEGWGRKCTEQSKEQKLQKPFLSANYSEISAMHLPLWLGMAVSRKDQKVKT